VAQTFDTTLEAIAGKHGTLERRFVAYFAFEEGLVPLRRIAKRLGLTSAGGISTLVSRCRDEIKRDPHVRTLADACRGRMRRHPPPFSSLPRSRQSPPATTTEPPRARDGSVAFARSWKRNRPGELIDRNANSESIRWSRRDLSRASEFHTWLGRLEGLQE
jgi:hypothetical protein